MIDIKYEIKSLLPENVRVSKANGKDNLFIVMFNDVYKIDNDEKVTAFAISFDDLDDKSITNDIVKSRTNIAYKQGMMQHSENLAKYSTEL